jgi:hypothetical protein
VELLTDLVVGRTPSGDGSAQRVKDCSLCADTCDVGDCTARRLDRCKSGLLLVSSYQLEGSKGKRFELTAHAGRSAKLCAQAKGAANVTTSAVNRMDFILNNQCKSNVELQRGNQNEEKL